MIRRATPTTVLSASGLPILSGVGPHQKVILAHISNPQSPGGGQSSSPIAIAQCPGPTNTGSSLSGLGSASVLPLIRPLQGGSPVIVRPASGQSQQFMVSIRRKTV